MNKTITLSTGAQMPVLGLGTWKSEPNKAGAAVEYALTEYGYKHIDGAAIYKNEPEIGQVYKKLFGGGKIKREEIFITSKLWNSKHKSADVLPACQETLKNLELEYLDLFLMHWGVAIPENKKSTARFGELDEQKDEQGNLITIPVPVQETWQAMEKLVDQGLVKAIGVANFTGSMLTDLLTYAKIKPAVNQVELHPYNPQNELVDFCKRMNIAVTAYSPLGTPGTMDSNEPRLLEDETVLALAKKYGKSPAQILINWAILRGTIVIPKSVTPEHIKNNAGATEFELTPDDVSQLSNIKTRHRYLRPWDWWKIPYFN